MSVTKYITNEVLKANSSSAAIKPMECHTRKDWRPNMPRRVFSDRQLHWSLLFTNLKKLINIMRVLKMIIVGQILAALTSYSPYIGELSEEEKQDFCDLKKCVDILQHEKKENIIHKLAHRASIVEAEIMLFFIFISV